MNELEIKDGEYKIVEAFKEAFKNGGSVNLQTDYGFLYFTGGALNKLVGKEHFIFKKINKSGVWVKTALSLD